MTLSPRHWIQSLMARLPLWGEAPAEIYGREPHRHDHPIHCSDCDRVMLPGEWVYWDEPSYEYDETDPYCRTCSKQHQAILDQTDWEALARESLK